MTPVVYGRGALLAAEHLDLRLIDLHERLLGQRQRPIVPAAALAQVWRGRSHLMLSRILAGCVVLPVSEDAARAAGELCTASGTSDIADAIVAVTAVARRGIVITGDPGELRSLNDPLGGQLRIHQL